MLLNKETLLGLYGGNAKKITFNVSWNTYSTIITAYAPPINENDRPRINTWRSDGSYVVYMSAGYQVYDAITKTITTPWGDRTTGIETVNIRLRPSQIAGVDYFTDNRLPIPALTPTISQWTITNTGNPNEIKYQYFVDRYADPIQNVSIDAPPITLGATLINFKVTTKTGNTEVTWGDNSDDTLTSGVPYTHTFFCSTIPVSPSPNNFWNNISACI